MERWQKQQVQRNLVELIKSTVCNEMLLARLTATNILDASESELFNCKHLTPLEQSKLLYEIVQTRVGSFSILIEALEETKQSGAVKILKGERQNLRYYGCITYDKNSLIGKGSFGTKIYKGTFDGKDVAVKVLLCEQLESSKACSEIELLKLLDLHENIIRYYFAECDDNYIYIALERCDISLQDEIKLKMMRMAPADIFCKCTAGLAHLHQSNIIHRDIKPANILLGYPDKVKLSDFGLSKQIPVGASSVAVASGVVGTADWMAPEILAFLSEEGDENSRILKMNASSDIFSLGCVFFFTLTGGRHPFGKPSQRTFYIAENKPQLGQLSNKSRFFTLVASMLSHEPKQRPSIADVKDQISKTGKCNEKIWTNNLAEENKLMEATSNNSKPHVLVGSSGKGNVVAGTHGGKVVMGGGRFSLNGGSLNVVGGTLLVSSPNVSVNGGNFSISGGNVSIISGNDARQSAVKDAP